MKPHTLKVNTVIAVLFALAATTQCLAGTIQQVSQGVLLLYRAQQRNTTNQEVSVDVESGTGFLVSDSNYVFLVTAEHVASMLGTNAHVVFGAGNEAPQDIALTNLIPSELGVWFQFHPQADVAAAPVRASDPAVQRLISGRAFPLSYFAEKKQSPDYEVVTTTLGFPTSVLLSFPNSPIVKESKPASELRTMRRFDNGKPCQFFLLQDPAIGGMSGGPVWDFVQPQMGSHGITIISGVQPKCLGIVHGAIADQTGGKLAAITPSFYIVELIKQVEGWIALHSQPNK